MDDEIREDRCLRCVGRKWQLQREMPRARKRIHHKGTREDRDIEHAKRSRSRSERWGLRGTRCVVRVPVSILSQFVYAE